MKRNFVQIIMGAISVALGFSSCKKDDGLNCVDCLVIFDHDANAKTVCVGDEDAETQAKFDLLVAYYKDLNPKHSQRCDK